MSLESHNVTFFHQTEHFSQCRQQVSDILDHRDRHERVVALFGIVTTEWKICVKNKARARRLCPERMAETSELKPCPWELNTLESADYADCKFSVSQYCVQSLIPETFWCLFRDKSVTGSQNSYCLHNFESLLTGLLPSLETFVMEELWNALGNVNFFE